MISKQIQKSFKTTDTEGVRNVGSDSQLVQDNQSSDENSNDWVIIKVVNQDSNAVNIRIELPKGSSANKKVKITQNDSDVSKWKCDSSWDKVDGAKSLSKLIRNTDQINEEINYNMNSFHENSDQNISWSLKNDNALNELSTNIEHLCQENEKVFSLKETNHSSQLSGSISNLHNLENNISIFKSKLKNVIFREQDFWSENNIIEDEIKSSLEKCWLISENELQNFDKNHFMSKFQGQGYLKGLLICPLSESSYKMVYESLHPSNAQKESISINETWNSISVKDLSDSEDNTPSSLKLNQKEREDIDCKLEARESNNNELSTFNWEPLNSIWSSLNQEISLNNDDLLISEIDKLHNEFKICRDTTNNVLLLNALEYRLKMLIYFKNIIQMTRFKKGIPTGFQSNLKILRDIETIHIPKNLIKDIKKIKNFSYKDKKRLRSNWKSSIRFFLKGHPLNTVKLFSDYKL